MDDVQVNGIEECFVTYIDSPDGVGGEHNSSTSNGTSSHRLRGSHRSTLALGLLKSSLDSFIAVIVDACNKVFFFLEFLISGCVLYNGIYKFS